MQLRFVMNYQGPAALPELWHDPKWETQSSSDTTSIPVFHMPQNQNVGSWIAAGCDRSAQAEKSPRKSERQAISNTCCLPLPEFILLKSLPSRALSHCFQGLFGGSSDLNRSLAPSSATVQVMQPGTPGVTLSVSQTAQI